MDLLKQKEIEKILKEAYKYRNSNYSIDKIVELTRYYGLKKEDLDGVNPKKTNQFFYEWSKYTRDTVFSKSKLDINCFSKEKWWIMETDSFSDFYTDEPDNYKIYLPLDYNHLENGVKILIDFFKKNDIPMYMKVSHEMRSDNINIRVAGYQNAKKIIDFIELNKYLSEGKNKLSPFIPNFSTVGLVKDKGEKGSYNESISYAIGEYIKKPNCSYTYNDFVNYLKNDEPPHYIFNNDMEKYFGYKSEYFKNQSIKENNNKNKNKTETMNKKFDIVQKKAQLLEFALYCTYEKYNNEFNLEMALLEAINNNYNYFTRNINQNNNINLRNKLMETVKPSEIRGLMIFLLVQKNFEIYDTMTNQQLAFLLSNSFSVKEKEGNYTK